MCLSCIGEEGGNMPAVYEYPTWIFADDEEGALPNVGDLFVVERIEGPGDFYWVGEQVYLVHLRKVGSGGQRSAEIANPWQPSSGGAGMPMPDTRQPLRAGDMGAG